MEGDRGVVIYVGSWGTAVKHPPPKTSTTVGTQTQLSDFTTPGSRPEKCLVKEEVMDNDPPSSSQPLHLFRKRPLVNE